MDAGSLGAPMLGGKRNAYFLESLRLLHVLEPDLTGLMHDQPVDAAGYLLYRLDPTAQRASHNEAEASSKPASISTCFDYGARVQPLLAELVNALLEAKCSPKEVVPTASRWLQRRAARIQHPQFRVPDPASQIQEPGSRTQDAGSPTEEKDAGPRILDAGCRIPTEEIEGAKDESRKSAARVSSQDGLQDPRELLVNFFQRGDARGPLGMLPHATSPLPVEKQTSWFAVFRPTSSDAISTMRCRSGRGKGLNVKGKSAKQGELSGYVPFLQISENEHRHLICTSPSDARSRIYYSSAELRAAALKLLQPLMESMKATSDEALVGLKAVDDGHKVLSDAETETLCLNSQLHMEDPSVSTIDKFAPDVYGLDMPEKLMREAYIMKRDITHKEGWETGRASEPAFMDMNLHALREHNPMNPKVVLFQYDKADEMNPRGLLVAYEEDRVTPVVSDFDALLVGSRGMSYEPLPHDQLAILNWCLGNIEKILTGGSNRSWTSMWLEILKHDHFHPEFPKFGFGDPTSVNIVSHAVDATASCGAVRHGAECFNFFFPQEMDKEYMIIWDGFESPGYTYAGESDLREFLLERVPEGYSFPLNPAWILRDPQWVDVWHALRTSPAAQGALASWYPADSGITERIETIASKFPHGLGVKNFKKSSKENMLSTRSAKLQQELDPEELADMAMLELQRDETLQRAKKKIRAFLLFSRSMPAGTSKAVRKSICNLVHEGRRGSGSASLSAPALCNLVHETKRGSASVSLSVPGLGN